MLVYDVDSRVLYVGDWKWSTVLGTNCVSKAIFRFVVSELKC